MPADRRDARREDRFEELYVRNHPSIYAFVYRGLAGLGAEVSDVVAEVFAVAWRRLDDVPETPEDRLWLYGVARRCVARARRSDRRRRRLHARLSEEARVQANGKTDDAPAALVSAAIERLRRADREVLQLVMWEDLTYEQAGRVLGCSANAVALRLHRAKKRLQAELEGDPAAPPGQVSLANPGAGR